MMLKVTTTRVTSQFKLAPEMSVAHPDCHAAARSEGTLERLSNPFTPTLYQLRRLACARNVNAGVTYRYSKIYSEVESWFTREPERAAAVPSKFVCLSN